MLSARLSIEHEMMADTRMNFAEFLVKCKRPFSQPCATIFPSPAMLLVILIPGSSFLIMQARADVAVTLPLVDLKARHRNGIAVARGKQRGVRQILKSLTHPH